MAKRKGPEAATQAWGMACLLLALLAQLPGSGAICYVQAQAPCVYNGKHFGPGKSWHGANCSKCFCLHPLSVGCCERMRHPVDFPDWCEVRYDSRNCKVSLVQKARPSLPCLNNPGHGWGSGQAADQPGHQPPRKRAGRNTLGG